MRDIQIPVEQIADMLREMMIDQVVPKLMEKFDKEVIPFEDEEDPMKPSLCKEEFQLFLEDSIKDSITIENLAGGIKQIHIGIGDDKSLGLDEELDKDTTDCIKIVGTILTGIIGEYVLVTVAMAKKMFPGISDLDLGRTGKAYLMPVEEYKAGVDTRGWDPKPMWSFSNFRGVPDFFDVNIDKIVEKCVTKMEEVLS